MGFSVSGATALLFIAFLIAFGAFYTATTGAVEQVQDAQIDQTDRSIETLNTEIEINDTQSEYNSTAGSLTIVANNTGASTLQVADLSLLVDGAYIPFSDWGVNLSNPAGDSLWIPQQTLTITLDDTDLAQTPPGTVRLVTEYGIAVTWEVA
jgi:flagellar protein FlaF